MRQIAHRYTTIEKSQVPAPSVTDHYGPTGTAFLALREIECQTSVYLHTTAEPMLQVGFGEDIRPSNKELCQEQYVITGSTTAAGGRITSKSETVVITLCTSYRSPRDAIIVTVVLDTHVRNFILCSTIVTESRQH